LFLFFLSYSSRTHRDLHSFPTRRSSDLYAANLRGPGDPRAVDVRGMTLVVAKDALCAGTGLASIPTTTQCPVAVPIGVNEISVRDRKSTRLNSSHVAISYAVFCLKKKNI